MIDLQQYEIWFITGSQHLYGPETLEQVARDSQIISAALDASINIPVRVVFKPVLTSSESILELCQQANAAKNCIGLIAWMHTFSPAQMWIVGLSLLKKPFAHLHTQFNREIPWAEIDMDYMNLHQSAHGDREFGFIASRMRLERKVIVGHWQDEDVQISLGIWARAAAAWADWHGARIVRFGDNMRDVAVTEGDKVAGQRLRRGRPGRSRPPGGRLGDRRAAGPIRCLLPPGARPPPQRLAARLPPRGGSDRGGPPLVPRGRRVQRIHNHV